MNLVHAATLSEFQRVMLWRLILEEFGPNIQHISGVEKIVADTIIRLPYIYVNKNYPGTSKAQCHAYELFTTGRDENNKD